MAGAKRLSSDLDTIVSLLRRKISCLRGDICCKNVQLTIDTGLDDDFV
jgi:hypothetical protein